VAMYLGATRCLIEGCVSVSHDTLVLGAYMYILNLFFYISSIDHFSFSFQSFHMSLRAYMM
jgi:hypothetical protein